MTDQNKSFIIITVLLCLSSFISWSSYLSKGNEKDTVNVNDFPREIDGWSSEDIPLSKLELDVLETDNVFIRRYTNARQERVYLYVIYSRSNRKVYHPPEVCYTGSGVTIVEKVHDQIPVGHDKRRIPAIRLLIEYKNSRQIAYYWYKSGGSFTSNYWLQQAQIVMNNLMGQRTGNALIRVSVDINGQDKDSAVKTGEGFVNSIVPDLYRYLP
jgi:EpsI family protein